MFFPQTVAQWHAALNDIPSVLLLVAVVLEFAALVTKRPSLGEVAMWSLLAGAGGAVVALIAGLRAASTIDHGGSVHLVMARHQTLGIAMTVLFLSLAGWRMWRRARMTARERQTYLGTAVIGVVLMLWTAHLGGTIVYEYGGGIPTPVLEGALEERAREHSHADSNSGAAEHEHD